MSSSKPASPKRRRIKSKPAPALKPGQETLYLEHLMGLMVPLLAEPNLKPR